MQDVLEFATDDVSNVWLDPSLVVEARKTEIKFFSDMKVYDSFDRAEMTRRGGKNIKTRWIYVNTGDSKSPNYRSRLVGK